LKILLLSDLHIPTRCDIDRLKAINFDVYDQIFLTGDITSVDVLDFLDNQRPILQVVHGNMDDLYIKNKLPQKVVIELYGKTFGLIHGHQTGVAIPEKLIKYFNEKLDVLVFGHTHFQEKYHKSSTIFINPGAFCEGYHGEIEMDEINFRISLLHL